MQTQRNSDVKYFDTNDNKRTININNNDIQALKKLEQRETKDMLNSKSKKALEDSIPETREELLALDLAEGLNDRKSLPLYLTYARRYPEGFLRRALGAVKEIPDEKIRISRGALFNYLIKKHAQGNAQNHRS